jgi:hypothetical protein
MPQIPRELSEISTDWIEDCLGTDSGSLIGFRLEPMGAGVGMMSAMSIIHLEWNDNAEGPASLVIKLASDNETNRAVSQQFNLYLKEVSYYRDLAPRSRARSPRVYASDIDDEQNFFLLMEDVSDYRLGNQVTGATLEEAQVCVTELGRLHASFWNQVDDIDWLPNMSNSENARNMALGAEAGWPQMIEYFGDLVPASINGMKDRYLARIPSLQEQLDQPPRTLIHGDFRMDNMLFGQADHHDPLLIVDFQGPLKGNGIHDFAYLMSHSVKTEVRRAHEAALLEQYVGVLNSAGVPEYSLGKATEDYRLGVLYAWTVAVVIAGTLDPANERGFAWMSKMVERNGLALEDLDCLSLI